MESGFSGLPIKEAFLQLLTERGITQPTPVQAETIPHVAAGRDVVARSQTGTGKTLAYLLPILSRIDAAAKAVQAVVVVPTQELGMQIYQECEAFKRASGIRALPLIGGAALSRQVEKLRQVHPHLVVGTPGRLLELVRMKRLALHQVQTVVVDEVDQVFALSSASDVEQLLFKVNPRRQLLFFSATIPDTIRDRVGRWMKSPEWVQIAPQHRVAETLEHAYLLCDERDKIDMLRRLIRLQEPKSAIVFINDTEEAAEVESKLKYVGLPIEPLYGDAGKQDRSRVMQGFRSGRFPLLLATDVAARGLDLTQVTHVYNLDPPRDADHYVHRAGRTGRMGRSGNVFSIVTPRERFIIEKFEKALGIRIPERAMFEGKLVSPEDVRSRGAGGRGTARERTGQAPSGTASARRSPSAVTGGPNASSGQAVGNVSAASAVAGRPGEGRQKQSGGRQQAAAATAAKKVNGANKEQEKEKQRKERERDKKNKGAPRWLKEKMKLQPQAPSSSPERADRT